MPKRIDIRKIVFGAVIAALYIALTIAIAPISYGPVQFRISEVLTILPFFFPVAVPGLFIGCVIANLLSPYGMLDVVVGSVASLLAGLCTMWIGKVGRKRELSSKILACFPPVGFNAIFIGAMIAWLMVGFDDTGAFLTAFALNSLSVGFGQLVVLYALGLPLLIYLPKTQIIEKLNMLYGKGGIQ